MFVKNVFYLGNVLFWRNMREFKFKILLSPLTSLALIVFILGIILYNPEKLNSGSIPMLNNMAIFTFGEKAKNQTVAMAVVFLLWIAPYIMSLFVATNAANNGQGIFANEASFGGLEYLCSTPYKTIEIFCGIFVCSLYLTFLMWAILIGGLFFIFCLLIMFIDGAIPSLDKFQFLPWIIPLPLGVFSSLIAMTISILFPSLAKIRTGGTGNAIQLISIAPALSITIYFLTSDKINPFYISTIAVAVSLIGALIIFYFLSKLFKPEKIL